MAELCGACNSADVQHGLDRYKCLTCGRETKYDGTLAEAPHVDYAGNIADGQRAAIDADADNS